jgi:Ran GTPase-activating protein (RanGAP) involved in mRNA processing and transport
MILNAKLAEVQAENRTETEGEYPNPLRYVSSSHPVHKIIRKLMNTIRLKAWHAWMCWHSSHMNKKQRIIDQYVMCCAKMKPKRSPFLRNSLRCFLFKPSANKLDLAGSGMSSRDIQTVFCALAGQGAGLKEDHAVNIVEICDEFGDSTLEQLDLSRNNIGADGARALVDILVKCKFFRQQKLKRTPSITTAPTSLGCITTLDLSRNHLGPSSTRHLKTLLTKDGCSIIGLFLAGNNFGDSGCTTIISALNEQDSLKTLDLSENGAATASGTAMGAMLIVNFTLTHLYFSYNSLSGAGARAACQGLAQNNTLETLMLQWNGLGDDKTMEVLGNALMTCSLKILSIAENRIKLKGACILASTLELGTSLEALDLDGNKIGQIGARAILAAVSAASSDSDEFKTIVSTNNCGANIIDKNAFDPGEAAGEYDLNLCQSYDRTVLIKLIRVMLQGKGSFSPIRTGEKVLQYSLWLDGGMQGNIVHNESVDTADWSIVTSRGHTLPITENKDERGQLMPIEGVWARILNKKLESVSLTVKFAYASLRKRAGATDAMELKSYVMLHDGMADPEANRIHCENLINTVLGSDVFLTIEQAQILFNVINDPQDIRFNELGSVRVHFLYKCYHKLVESHRNKELLEWCSAMERKTLEKMLGSVSFAFTPNNPTGFHKLDLSDMPQREIALRLLEIRNDCEPRFQQLRKFYSSARAGGRRETPEDDLDLERCWRNSKYNGSVLRFFPDWRLPYFGILEVDFVEVTKPDPNDHKDGDLKAMKEGEFLKFVEGLLAIDSEDERVSAIRQYSNIGFFYCRQLAVCFHSRNRIVCV